MKKTTGMLLILIGLVLFIYKVQWFPLSSLFNWHFVLLLVGIAIILFAFNHSIPPFALLGGVVTTLGLSVWGSRYVYNWPTHPSLLFILIGLSFILQFIVSKKGKGKLSAIVGFSLLFGGILTWPSIKSIPILAPFAYVLIQYWPIGMVALGFLMIRK